MFLPGQFYIMKAMKAYIYTENRFIPGRIEYDNGIITEVVMLDEDELNAEERENYIIPGLIDIHLHGCMGADFCDASVASVEIISEYEQSVGVTSICPATMTYDEDTLTKIMLITAEYNTHRNNEQNKDNAADIVGIYLEGPFISYEKRGAQNPGYIIKPDASMVKRLNMASSGLIKVVTVAPEEEGAIDFIEEMHGDMVCSIAHTTADYETASRAMQAGADHVTHLYNAMPPLLSRAPGVVGAAFDDKSVMVELICDGVHVHPSVVRATFEMFGADRIVLISDSCEATGMPDNEYALGGQPVYKKGNLVTLSDGTIAGSVTNLFECMKIAVKMGISKEDAIKAATINPAKSIGVDDRLGSIEVGKAAKMVVCDKDLNLTRVIS